MLTIKQEKFVQYLIKGMSQREAYKKAYNAKYSDKAIDNKACELFKKGEVQSRYNELLEKLKDNSIMDAKERMIWLSNVINNKEQEDIYIRPEDGELIKVGSRNADLNTKLKSIDILNKMSGEYKTIIDGSLEVKEKLEDLL